MVDATRAFSSRMVVSSNSAASGFRCGGQLRMSVQVHLTHHRRGGVVREVVLVVFEQLQFEGIQAPVSGVHQAGKHLAVTQRGVDQPGVHLPGVLRVRFMS